MVARCHICYESQREMKQAVERRWRRDTYQMSMERRISISPIFTLFINFPYLFVPTPKGIENSPVTIYYSHSLLPEYLYPMAQLAPCEIILCGIRK